MNKGRMNEQYPLPLKAAVLALALGAAMCPAQSQAADITVDAIGTCTLADAITSANTDTATGGCIAGSSGADTITLETDVTLLAVLPIITTEITIEGAGHTIDGNGVSGDVLEPFVDGDLTLNEATVTGATGSGIKIDGFFTASSVTVTNSTVSNNTGAGIYCTKYSNVTVDNSTITANSNQGIFSNDGCTLTITNSTISGNGRDGINPNTSPVTVTNSTISGNTEKGIDSFSSSVTVENSTISNNGQGISFDNSSTPAALLTLKNSLISGNNNGGNGNEIYSSSAGAVTADASNVFGHNGETNAQAFSGFTPVHGSDFVATSDGGGTPTALASILSPLADNGGSTQTHALPAGSPAIDLDPTCGTGLTEDQRGYTRPFGSGCDAGSFEFGDPCGCGRDLPADTWLMTAPSCTPVPTGINAQYGTDLGGTYDTDWISFEWVTGAQEYNQQAGIDSLALGVGNWNYSFNAGTLTLSGTATPTEDCSAYGWTGQTCHAIDLTPAPDNSTDIWQLVGHPFPYTVDWADVRVAVNDGGWTAYTPSNAQAAGYVNKAYHAWNGSSYQTYDDSTPGSLGVLLPQEAIWLKILSGSSGFGPGNFKLLVPEK